MRSCPISFAVKSGVIAFLLLAAGNEGSPRTVTAVGHWILMADGQAAPSDSFIRGLQTSGLAFDGKLLWSVGDQRSAFPGHLFAIDPSTGWLERQPIPLLAQDPTIRARLKSWGKLDLEGIAIFPGLGRTFVAVIEDEATAAVVVRLDDSGNRAVVQAIWEFTFPGGRPPEPYRHDTNFRFEGIAIDPQTLRGYVGYERDLQGKAHLYEFDAGSATRKGIEAVPLSELHFEEWDRLGGKANALLNVNGLEFFRTVSGEPRLLVLCRDRELIFTLDPQSCKLVSQVNLNLRAPDDEPIEWASPEGIAVDEQHGLLYVVSDPDSTDGNWRARRTRRAEGNFAKFVPLLFEFKTPAELLR